MRTIKRLVQPQINDRRRGRAVTNSDRFGAAQERVARPIESLGQLQPVRANLHE